MNGESWLAFKKSPTCHGSEGFVRARLVLRLLYIPVSVCLCVCVRPQLSCALNLSYVIRYYATIATSAVETTGSLQAE